MLLAWKKRMANNVLVGQGPHKSTRQRDGWQRSQRSGAEYLYKIRIYQYTQKLPIPRNSRSQTKMASRMDNKLQGGCNKQYFPSVRDRLWIKLTLTTKLAAVLTGRGNTRAYFYRFKLRDDARCTCGQSDQTMDHLLFHCEKTSTQREVLKKHQLSHQREWMEIKQELISKHTKVFCEFIESTGFELLQQNGQ